MSVCMPSRKTLRSPRWNRPGQESLYAESGISRVYRRCALRGAAAGDHPGRPGCPYWTGSGRRWAAAERNRRSWRCGYWAPREGYPRQRLSLPEKRPRPLTPPWETALPPTSWNSMTSTAGSIVHAGAAVDAGGPGHRGNAPSQRPEAHRSHRGRLRSGDPNR